jgi:WD40 repeat protein
VRQYYFGKLRETASAEGKQVEWLALTADGKALATSSADGAIAAWDLGPPKRRFKIDPHIGTVNGVRISFDGKVLAAGGTNGGGLWRFSDGALLAGIDGDMSAIQFSPNGRTLAAVISSSGNDQREIRLWRLKWVESGK